MERVERVRRGERMHHNLLAITPATGTVERITVSPAA